MKLHESDNREGITVKTYKEHLLTYICTTQGIKRKVSMRLELSVYMSNVSSALKTNADTKHVHCFHAQCFHAQCFHAQCFHRTRTGVTGAALHDLYRGSNVSVMITNPQYEGSSGDLSTQGSDHPAAGGACGYGPVSVEHHKTCRAPPEGEPSLTTAKPTTAKPATAKPTPSSFVKLFSFLWPLC